MKAAVEENPGALTSLWTAYERTAQLLPGLPSWVVDFGQSGCMPLRNPEEFQFRCGAAVESAYGGRTKIGLDFLSSLVPLDSTLYAWIWSRVARE